MVSSANFRSLTEGSLNVQSFVSVASVCQEAVDPMTDGGGHGELSYFGQEEV